MAASDQVEASLARQKVLCELEAIVDKISPVEAKGHDERSITDGVGWFATLIAVGKPAVHRQH